MFIVHIVAERVRRHRGWICIGAAVSFVLLSIVASLPGFYRDEGTMPNVLAYRVAFLVDCSLWVAVLVTWLFGAGWFERALREPLRLWPGSPEYRDALDRYRNRCGIVAGEVPPFLRAPCRTGRRTLRRCQDSHIGAVKFLFYAGWSIYMAAVAAILWRLPLGGLHKATLIAVTLIATLPNGASYFLCVSYVWLLKDVAHGSVPSGLSHLLRWPSGTPEYQRLVAVSRFNSLFFLAVALLCSLASLLTCVLARGCADFCLLALGVLVALLGIATFLVLSVMSRAFERELVTKWELDSVAALERELGGRLDGPAPWEVERPAPSGEAQPGLRPDDVLTRQGRSLGASDLASFALGVLSLAADVASLLVTLGDMG